VRHRDLGDLGTMPVDQLIERIAKEQKSRADLPKPDAAQ